VVKKAHNVQGVNPEDGGIQSTETMSIAQTIEQQMIMIIWQGYGRKRLLSRLRHLAGICAGGTGKKLVIQARM
jgi:hypothetical protein